ncbi:MAG: acyl-CoA/acyl-ACP dehydrogenase [Deltaproteobacteria bacterium]|nr:acyl-CoA/acyl-ACP dehydrogenase [Deltaproteobacteria bacterium]
MDYPSDSLIDDQRELVAAARSFAARVLRPAGIELDRMPAAEVAARDSLLFRTVREAGMLGYTRMGGTPEIGGMGLSPLDRYLVLEQLGWGSTGITAVVFLASTPAEVALLSGDPGVIAEIALPYYACEDGSLIGCWAITEPDHGSDTLGSLRPELDVRARGQVIARRSGDDWILSGQKSAWVSNGPIATHAMLNVQLDANGNMSDSGVCLLALDLPGVGRGKPLEKHGIRSLPQGELFFDDVRVPARNMVIGREGYAGYMHSHLSAFNAGVGCVATGLARAAYECARDYCGARTQGGRPIFEHQSVRARLFRMHSLVQASFSLSRDAWVTNLTRIERGETPRLELSITSKVFCTQAALEVATLAVQLHGGNGMTKEYPVEMFLRDATALTVADGENAFLTQIAASLL